MAFHPDELAFFAAIHAAPLDDTPRLVYADWLDEHDQPEHAEFIRLQCARAAEVGEWSACDYTPRERSLVKRFGARWRGARVQSHGRLPGSLHFKRFHRGLPDVERYTTNYPFELDSLTRTLEHVAPHNQLMVLLNVYVTSDFPAAPMLTHPIFARAQRIHVRALGPARAEGPLSPEVPLPHEVVEAVVATFRNRKMIHVRFGPLTAVSEQFVKDRLSPHVPTITPAFPS